MTVVEELIVGISRKGEPRVLREIAAHVEQAVAVAVLLFLI